MIINYKELEAYLSDSMSGPVRVVPLEGKQIPSLALYIRLSFSFFRVSMPQGDFLLIQPMEGIPLNPGSIRPILKAIQHATNLDTGLLLTGMVSWQQQRYIKDRIPFVVPGRQLYLPMLALHLSPTRDRLREKRTRFRPATQAVLFRHLYRKDLEGLNQQEIAGITGYSAITISRAIDELNIAGLVRRDGQGFRFAPDQQKLWEMALPYLISPIKQIVFTDQLQEAPGVFRAGNDAMASYTDLAAAGPSCYAIFKQRLDAVEHGMISTVALSANAIRLELWSYPPELIAVADVVDPFSLYVSMKDDEWDERLAMACEQLIREAL